MNAHSARPRGAKKQHSTMECVAATGGAQAEALPLRRHSTDRKIILIESAFRSKSL